MNDEEYALLGVLADGRFHSGEALAIQFGITRAAIWKRIRRLAAFPGIDIESMRGKGHRLITPLELLDKEAIRRCVQPELQTRLVDLQVLPVIASTNAFLSDQCSPHLHGGHACVSEYQTAGRGRRGRQWVSVFGSNVYLSLAWRFDLCMADLAGLSIAVGVAVAQVLADLGLRSHGLKWPNDIHIHGKKLAGILVEAGGEMEGPCQAIIGLGLNIRLPASAAQDIDQPWTDLSACLDTLPGRNRLVGKLLDALLQTCVIYQQRGLAPFMETWNAYDIYLGQEVTLMTGSSTITGIYTGLDDQGGLVLEGAAGRQIWYSGEVSLRGQV